MQTQAIAGSPTTGGTKREQALAVAHKFEEILARQMVGTFRESTLIGEEGGMFGGGAGSSTYAAWFDEHMAAHVTRNRGLGVAQGIMRYLERIEQLGPR
ncbi:MAG: rod-binding protein [Planctomycetes bacterium]|nr:rod-binding protein [Planctomycetota bacterium]MCB9871986.1 rod-binding protein [Planctomycetota bacterium]MCB9888391.1 rod-binding protein [Planctomycetota bacterium]